MKLTKAKLKQIIKEEIANIIPGRVKALSKQAQEDFMTSPSTVQKIQLKKQECAKINKCMDTETFECIECDDPPNTSGKSPAFDEENWGGNEKNGSTPAHLQGPAQ